MSGGHTTRSKNNSEVRKRERRVGWNTRNKRCEAANWWRSMSLLLSSSFRWVRGGRSPVFSFHVHGHGQDVWKPAWAEGGLKLQRNPNRSLHECTLRNELPWLCSRANSFIKVFLVLLLPLSTSLSSNPTILLELHFSSRVKLPLGNTVSSCCEKKM